MGSPELISWAQAYRIEKGKPLDFRAFPYLVDIHRTFGSKGAREVVVKKASQCGVSASGITLALYAADIWGASVLYVLPGFSDAGDFTDARINPAIAGSKYLRAKVADTDNKGLKTFRSGGSLYVRGSGSEAQALSVPADLLILDEYDRLDRSNVPAFERRLSAPNSLGLTRTFSNPSFPETGISELYASSDQRRWMIRCSCGADGELSWSGDPFYVDEERFLIACSCGRTAGAEVISKGVWVPAYPSREAKGYHISGLMNPRADIAKLVRSHHSRDETSLQAHYNFDLGEGYSPQGSSLSSENIRGCQRNYDPPDSYHADQKVTAGVDVGKVLHVRVSRHLPDGKIAPLYIGEISGFHELDEIWARYDVDMGLIDERPEERAAREFCESHPRNAMLLRWSGSNQREFTVVDEANRLVVARRTMAADMLIEEFRSQKRLLPRLIPRDYVSHLTAVHRIPYDREDGVKASKYVNEKADDYFFAELHDMLAKEVLPIGPVDVAGPDPITIRDRIQGRNRRPYSPLFPRGY